MHCKYVITIKHRGDKGVMYISPGIRDPKIPRDPDSWCSSSEFSDAKVFPNITAVNKYIKKFRLYDYEFTIKVHELVLGPETKNRYLFDKNYTIRGTNIAQKEAT